MDDVDLAPHVCPACEQSETTQERFDKDRLPGMYRVWKHRPPEGEPWSDVVDEQEQQGEQHDG